MFACIASRSNFTMISTLTKMSGRIVLDLIPMLNYEANVDVHTKGNVTSNRTLGVFTIKQVRIPVGWVLAACWPYRGSAFWGWSALGGGSFASSIALREGRLPCGQTDSCQNSTHSSRVSTGRLLTVSGVCLLRVICLGGGGGSFASSIALREGRLPCGQTDSCQNITFPQLCFEGGDKRMRHMVKNYELWPAIFYFSIFRRVRAGVASVWKCFSNFPNISCAAFIFMI